jgi:protein-ribulosamine 3-kinase
MSDAAIRTGLATLLGTTVQPAPAERIAGDNGHACFRYQLDTGYIFVKATSADRLDCLQAEAAGLSELAGTNLFRTPRVLANGVIGEHALLILEWLALVPRTATHDGIIGERLAAMHQHTKPLFGLARSNYIGATPQVNFWSRSWTNFWREHRLEAQLNLAEQRGAHAEFIERTALLSALLDGFFTNHTPNASLLHGDLWHGNCAMTRHGEPALFDPAVYYGDRECDVGMAQLFGGFSDNFIAAYQGTWPLTNGWQQRIELYNLYHVLNHFNLFGGHYLDQATSMVNRLLAELGH